MAQQAQREGDAVTSPDDKSGELLKLIRELAVELNPHRLPALAISLDSALDKDVGLDSLARVELIARVEQHFAVGLPERVVIDVETPRDLLRALLRASGPRPVTTAPSGVALDRGEVEAAIPDQAETMLDVLRWHVTQHPDQIHITVYSDEGDDVNISYRQLWEGAVAVAAGLQQRGLQPGEPVAIMLPTSREYFFSFFGIMLAGGIPVPMYPPVRRSQIEDHLRRHQGILRNCLATTLITVPEARRFARLLQSLVETLGHVVTAEELCATSTTFIEPTLSTQDTAFLQYTSGSTGNPKGVVLSHANLLANIRAMGQVVQADSHDVFVSWLPLYHDMGLIGAWLGSLYYGALFVVMSPIAFLTRPERWLWAMQRYQGTLSASPNFGFELCLRRVEDQAIEGLDLSTWRAAFNGAEPVSPQTMEAFCDRFSHYGFRAEAMMPVYGLAESTVGLAFPPLDRGVIIDRVQRDPFMRDGRAVIASADDTKVLRFVACGPPLPRHQARIIGPAGDELPERQEGRLQFRGPSTTSGYYRNPEETRRLFDGEWLDSGDLAYIAGGDVYITGRSKDVIIRAGRNVYPQELEEVVGNIPGIRAGRVAVFGSSDPHSGTERLIVLAETRETDSTVLEQLSKEINSISVELVGTPPDDVVLAPPNTVLKTSSGKIRRAASRELYEKDRLDKQQKAVWWQVVRVVMAGLLPQLRRTRRALAAILYGAYAWCVFWVLAPLVWMTVAVLPRYSWRWQAMRSGARLLARATGTPIRLNGMENLPPPGHACVIVANHASYLDGPVLIAALPKSFSFLAKSELATRFISRVFLQRIKAEFVERFDIEKGMADMQRVQTLLRTGRSLMFFPEGTFTRMPGVLPFHMGAFLVAAETGVPVVPVAMHGTRSILRAESWFPHRGAITITIGAPIQLQVTEEQAEKDTWRSALQLRDATRTHILRYSGEPDLGREESPLASTKTDAA